MISSPFVTIKIYNPFSITYESLVLLKFHNYVFAIAEGASTFNEISAKSRIQQNKLPKWWYRDVEIGLIGVGKDEVVFFEAEWSDLRYPQAKKILMELERKSENVKIDSVQS